MSSPNSDASISQVDAEIATIDQSKRDETYTRNLAKEIEQKKKFSKAIELVLVSEDYQNEAQQVDKETALKKRAIALYETLNRQPYNPERGEVLGIALAQSNMKAQIQALEKYKEQLVKKKERLNQKWRFQKGTSVDLKNLARAIDERHSAETDKRRQFVTDRNPEATRVRKARQRLEALEEREEEMVAHLRYTLDTYFIQPKIDLLFSSQSEAEIKRVRQRALKLVEKLINEIFEGTFNFISVDGSDPFVRHLVKGNVVEQKNQMTQIRLHRFDTS
ncbi:unnamed protein product [Kuraishia capsulata CBS 1993]|uniref:Uncharacterized protein n=1 Tax=Kuraishia capsulata CBS 1993 TaxID=1382522 RepID=W6MXD0_9ASCO|nr:uncharacterized protein KUCA_T00004659001 [Kuraishia capsulata CBS 1993]CDK28675.1 unnamed protein product [Kuraishia capsulata CBS 1993]